MKAENSRIRDDEGNDQVRYLVILKAAENQLGGNPPPELFAAIAKLGEEATKAGVLLDTGGLTPVSAGAEVRLEGGKITVTDGPFTEAKETITSYAMYELRSQEEAVEWTSRFLRCHQELWPGWEGSSEIRRVMGPEDFTNFPG
ncbi:YciI family protein [Kineosporia rhizophila]|uniref:YciI family protein n=1 Tax=Kineosporia TaxID=49184 RepID=UPI000AEFAEF4|nr:YciI family protein [Kineosporia sp. NBRC 101677]MCE0539190.1 YciI family protein [Kineosporia rhizophila]GLY18046.1 transcriptional regulator [Kineosporia sp. NBRC 101677]